MLFINTRAKLCLSLLSILVLSAQATEPNCKNLHKVTDIDDLLAQMHSNINTHCIFEIPSEELERIWGIEIFDFTNKTPEEEDEVQKERTKYDEEELGIFLVRYIIKEDNALEESGETFNFSMTRKFSEMYAGWGGSLDKGLLSSLPPPDTEIFHNSLEDFLIFHGKPHCSVSEENKKQNFYLKCNGNYYWWNGYRSAKLPYLKITTNFSFIPGVIKFCKTANCY